MHFKTGVSFTALQAGWGYLNETIRTVDATAARPLADVAEF
jgi:hypothetical protein